MTTVVGFNRRRQVEVEAEGGGRGDGEAALDVLVAGAVAAESLVGPEHLLATRAPENLPTARRQQKETRGDLVLLGVSGGRDRRRHAASRGVDAAPVALRVAPHVPEQRLPREELFSALRARRRRRFGVFRDGDRASSLPRLWLHGTPVKHHRHGSEPIRVLVVVLVTRVHSFLYTHTERLVSVS